MVKENLDGYFGPGLTARIATVEGVLPLMLIGMGLCKLGLLSAKSSNRVYAWTAVLGFGISSGVPIWPAARLCPGFLLTLDTWIWLPYTLTSDPGMLAMAASVMLLIKHGVFQSLQRVLAAVDRIAFSNYIGTSLLCQFIFLWGPWRLYGKLEYYQLVYVVAGVGCNWDRQHTLAKLLRVWSTRTAVAFAYLRQEASAAIERGVCCMTSSRDF